MFIVLLIITIAAILGFELWRHRARPAAAVRLRRERFPLPAEGVFVTDNHLLAVLSGTPELVLRPDAFLREATGEQARFQARSHGAKVRAGETLYRVPVADHELVIAAPFDGRIMAATGDTVVFAPRDLAESVRRMRIGAEVKAWWEAELERLSRFLGESAHLQTVMADGGELVNGYLTQLPADDVRRFSLTFTRRI